MTLGIPGRDRGGYLEDLAAGFMAAADEFGAVLAGGDTVSSPVLFAAVTVVGHAGDAGDFVLRSGAGSGDLVAVTGGLGGAAAGLWLLENDDGSGRRPRSRRPGRADRTPAPAHAPAVRGPRPRRHGATAMVDVSDGLARDLGHIADMSGVRSSCDARLVPAQAGVAAVEAAAGRRPGTWHSPAARTTNWR